MNTKKTSKRMRRGAAKKPLSKNDALGMMQSALEHMRAAGWHIVAANLINPLGENVLDLRITGAEYQPNADQTAAELRPVEAMILAH